MDPSSSLQAGPAFAGALDPSSNRARASRPLVTRRVRWSLGVSLALLVSLLSPPARGLPPPPELDEGPRLTFADQLDRSGSDLWAPEPSGAPLWFALDTQAGQRTSGETGFSAMLVLGLPLERMAARPRLRAGIAEAPATAPAELKPPARTAKVDAPLPAPAPKLPAASAGSAPPPLRIPAVVTPAAARAAVNAALRRAQLVDPGAQVDALAARARRAAILPELRLRASRTVDEGQTLSPTEYDPTRRTATGGTSLWLEARATWRLDRLVFADDEIALERLREHRAELAQRLTTRVLEKLFLWQRATALADDGSASPEENLTARLHALEAEAELDLLTNGWFSAWRAGAAEGGAKAGEEAP